LRGENRMAVSQVARHHEPALVLRHARIHIAAAVEMIVDLGGGADHPPVGRRLRAARSAAHAASERSSAPASTNIWWCQTTVGMGETTMRRFMVLMVTEIDFVSDTDEAAQNYEKHVAEVVKEAAEKLSLRTIEGNRVVKVQVTEIKDVISL
jgi:hypothetical protein